jgi:hypothetical protein
MDIVDIEVRLEGEDSLKATLNGVCVGRCRFFLNRWHYHPCIYSLVFSDLAGDSMADVVTGLYRKVVEVLRPRKPLLLRTGVREDDSLREALGPLGFREYRRVYEPVLEVEAFDLGQLAAVKAEFARLGYRLVSLADLEWTTGIEQQFYEMYNEVYADTSTVVPATPEQFSREEWLEQVLGEAVIPGAFFIATWGEALAGFGNLFKGEREGELETGTFGTVRAFRHHHREIMLTIKAREIAYAKAHGYRAIRAEIDAENPWTLHICAELPFVQGKDYLSLVRVPNWTVR